jgi:hypothetical protein
VTVSELLVSYIGCQNRGASVSPSSWVSASVPWPLRPSFQEASRRWWTSWKISIDREIKSRVIYGTLYFFLSQTTINENLYWSTQFFFSTKCRFSVVF